jgi:hypothetical protein
MYQNVPKASYQEKTGFVIFMAGRVKVWVVPE